MSATVLRRDVRWREAAVSLLAIAPLLAGAYALWVLLPVCHWHLSDFGREQLPALSALAGGSLRGLALLPPYGVSVLVRLPVALPLLWFGAGRATLETGMSLAALLPAVLLTWWAFVRIGVSAGAVALAMLASLLGPLAVLAVASAHADMLVACALMLAAVAPLVSCARPVTVRDGLLLAAAVALRPDLAVIVLLLAVRGAPRRLLAPSLIVLLLGLAGALLLSSTGSAMLFGAGGGLVRTPSIWALLHLSPPPGVRLLDLAACALAALATRRIGLLQAICVVVAVRCALDPWLTWYYPLPAIFALTALEVRRYRLPVLAVLAPVAAVLVVVGI